jgi:hypothetical protein
MSNGFASALVSDRIVREHLHDPAAALRFGPCQLLAQHLICLGVDLLLIGCAQFALMLHLGSASFGIPRVARVWHWVFALFGQSKFFARLSLLFRCCEFCHYALPPES